MHDHHQGGKALGRGDADIAHVRGDTRLRDRDPVLHLDLRNIEVGAELKGHVNLETAISGRVGGHVDHVFEAVDLLLKRSDHDGGDHVRARPGILTADPHTGGAISGYWATGSRPMDTAPRITNAIETT